jgi:hypothetical protein
MTTLTEAFPNQETKSLYLQAGDLEFDAILRLDGIGAMASVLHLAFQEGGDLPSESTIHTYCTLINMEVETIKKDLEKIVKLIKGRD